MRDILSLCLCLSSILPCSLFHFNILDSFYFLYIQIRCDSVYTVDIQLLLQLVAGSTITPSDVHHSPGLSLFSNNAYVFLLNLQF